jgi:cytochrome P450
MVLSTLAYFGDPYGAGLRTQARYGATYALPTAFGPMVVTGDPDGVRELLGAEPDTYAPLGVELLGPIMGEASLILLGGARHRAARKLLAPPFHGARLRAYSQAMIAIARAEAAGWPRDRRLALSPRTQAISLRVIVETVFGVADPAHAARYRAVLVELIEALDPSFMFFERLRSALWPPWRRFRRAVAAVEALVFADIARRRAAPGGDDILSALVTARYEDGRAPDDREVLEQLLTMLVAGHETTAIALAWAIHLVATHAPVAERLAAELHALGPEPDPEAIARAPYLEAVCHETLRLRPIAPTIGRRLARPMTLRGHELPAGVAVGASVIAVHRRPELYPEPDAFRPERFLERSFAPHEYLPFGGGARRCLGATFALHEMKLVLAALLAQHGFVSDERGAVRVRARNTVVGPRGGLHVRLTPPR